ncbi:MAG: sigma-70 family RNA polymerase sigma factor [Acidobacteria bacterium]|nr:sigma-70 family RNA polymerase sigma factor [Acidobacteriota bacterium]MBI3423715.1 sigma-70 family RNA polymerase sigma factor [Acidobacteriota bacterium]
MATAPTQVTQLLRDWRNGDQAAFERLLPLVYDELRRLAGHYLRGERRGHTLQSAALVHEAYLQLLGQEIDWQGRAHFLGVAAQAMRRVLVDYARSRNYQKRGGQAVHVEIEAAATVALTQAGELVALDDALQGLEKLDPRKSRVVELRYFGGLSVEETAEVLGISVPTVVRDWNTAKAWLRREMSRGASDDA